ncbi:type IVB secretion system protein IcmH/DotU [Sphingomonas profundi]|uniref:type IVB secretion system protein IcmH/DotU n=1 Tax=Alterirhizorhabdus profundi TaxID=2681549 RepID=UPI0012E79F00|nr:type IVB secretion system protein IcmH/DotU [Sphingomonas profundi]
MSDEPGNPKPPTERTIIRPGRAAGAATGGFPPAGGPPPGTPAEAERTVISPGRAPPGFPPPPAQSQAYAAAPPPPAAASGGPARIDFADAEPDLYGPEPLVAAAGRLIHLASRLRAMPIGPDLPQLRQLVIRELDAFRPRAQALGLDPKTVQLAHYILCAFMDDAVMSTPWGANSPWSQHSLLAAYHNDVQGGERLFEFAERMEQDPKREPRLMELLYQCLSLGFEGRMAVDPRGASLLQQRRARLAAAIGGVNPAPAAELSPQWRGTTAAAGAFEPKVPLWAILAGLGLIALVIFSALLFRLSSQSSAAVAALNQTVGTAQIVSPPPTPETKTATFDRISSILAPDVASGRLAVLREGQEIVLRLVNQGLFESAQAEPASAWSDTFGRLAQAANLTKGPIRIEGHTDNQQIRSLQFPSNLDLSVARARAVGAKLGGAGLADSSRISTSGLGDAQPIGDNASPDGRRQNRRVEIHVANDVAWQ